MCRAKSATCRKNRHFSVTSGQKPSLGRPGSFASQDFEAAKTKIAEQAAVIAGKATTIADLESSLSLEAGMHQVAAGKVAGLEAQIGAMSVYEGSLLREKNSIAAELGIANEKLRRVENEKKGIREAQHKLFQARDKERELVLKEVLPDNVASWWQRVSQRDAFQAARAAEKAMSA